MNQTKIFNQMRLLASALSIQADQLESVKAALDESSTALQKAQQAVDAARESFSVKPAGDIWRTMREQAEIDPPVQPDGLLLTDEQIEASAKETNRLAQMTEKFFYGKKSVGGNGVAKK